MLGTILISIGVAAVAIGVGYLYLKSFFEQKENYIRQSYESDIEELNNRHVEEIAMTKKKGKESAARSLVRSKQVLNGSAAENLVPHMSEFPYYPGDCRQFGSPIDYVVFDGITARDECDEIVFVEVKTGRSRLNKRQKAIKQAILDKKVKWLEFRVPTKQIKLEHKPKLAENDECLCKTCLLES